MDKHGTRAGEEDTVAMIAGKNFFPIAFHFTKNTKAAL
jgi:hypothetical protein